MNKHLTTRRVLVFGIILLILTIHLNSTTSQDGEKSSLFIFNQNWIDISQSEFKNNTRVQSLIDDDTIVHKIIRYPPPYTPKNPHPEDNAVNVPINTYLSWTGGDPDIDDNVTYDVYFGNELRIQKVASNISITIYDPGILTDYFTYKWSIVAWDNSGLSMNSPTWQFTTSNVINNKPYKPNQPLGQTNGLVRYEYFYTTSTFDPDTDQVYYLWDWGDGNDSGWIGPYHSWAPCEAKHLWSDIGNYTIKVKAKDIHDFESDWSDPLPITMPTRKIGISYLGGITAPVPGYLYFFGDQLFRLKSEKTIFLFGEIQVTANFTAEGARIKTVQFYLDDILMNEDTTLPYSVTLSMKHFGPAIIKVTAIDILGHSTSDTLNIDNYIKLI